MTSGCRWGCHSSGLPGCDPEQGLGGSVTFLRSWMRCGRRPKLSLPLRLTQKDLPEHGRDAHLSGGGEEEEGRTGNTDCEGITTGQRENKRLAFISNAFALFRNTHGDAPTLCVRFTFLPFSDDLLWPPRRRRGKKFTSSSTRPLISSDVAKGE